MDTATEHPQEKRSLIKNFLKSIHFKYLMLILILLPFRVQIAVPSSSTAYKTSLSDSKKLLEEYKTKNSNLEALLSKQEGATGKSTDKTNHEDTSKKCDKDPHLWEYLSPSLKSKINRNRTGGSLFYDIAPLEWSDDCNYLPFLIQPVGREGPFSEETLKQYNEPSGLYFYNDKTKSAKLVFENQFKTELDYSQSSSNYWAEGRYYVFKETTYPDDYEYVVTSYQYDVTTDRVVQIKRD